MLLLLFVMYTSYWVQKNLMHKLVVFEAIDLFPKAKDTVIVHAGGVSVYEANKVRGFAGDDGVRLLCIKRFQIA